MRYTRFATLFIFAALVAVGLSACDFSEQNYDIEPGDELEIRAASGDQLPDDEDDPSTAGFQRFVPEGASSFYIFPYTIDKEYTWSVEGPGDISTSTRDNRGDEYLDVTFEEPGDYTVSVESVGQGDEYSGSFTFEAVYPDVGTQAGRFGALISAYGAGSLADSLAEDDNAPYTVLSPSSDALTTAFGETDEGDADLPTTALLWDLAQYHVLLGEVESGQIVGSHPTLEGVTANIGGGVEVENADISAANGLVHVIDQVLEPPFAMVDFLDQAAAIDDEATPADTTVTVASVYLPDGGYVVIEDEDGNAVSAVSSNLESGFHNDVALALNDGVELTDEGAFSAAVYQDSGLNTPYTRDGEDVADAGVVGPPAE